jgi:hypothetical protein
MRTRTNTPQLKCCPENFVVRENVSGRWT